MFWLGPLAPKVVGSDSKTYLKSSCCAILVCNVCMTGRSRTWSRTRLQAGSVRQQSARQQGAHLQAYRADRMVATTSIASIHARDKTPPARAPRDTTLPYIHKHVHKCWEQNLPPILKDNKFLTKVRGDLQKIAAVHWIYTVAPLLSAADTVAPLLSAADTAHVW